jgi:carboxyl-terminal processing protease
VKLSNTRLFALIAVLFISTTGFSQSQDSTARIETDRSTGTSVRKAGKPVTPDVIRSEMREALSVIKENYGGAKSIDYNEVVKASIDSMLHALDPHSNYFDAKEFEQFKTDQSSKYFGIGATIGDLSDADGKVLATYIKATFEGAPAHRAGLRYGDKILEVNGASMLGKPFGEVRDFLRGPKGTKAKIVVERLATGQRETVDIVRDAVAQPSISEIYMIRPGVGYMAMNGGFNQTTYAEFVQGMRELKAAGMQQLVIDLRDNGGGLVSQAYRVANTFLAEGQTVFTQRGRIEGVNERYPAQNPSPDRSPVVILVNRNTASASEILAGALQDHDRALIVGENTFGKGLVQNPFLLDHGSMLLLTIAKYETPSGRTIQRDYSNGELYNYYTNGGLGNRDESAGDKPKGPETKTDTGRTVYGGGGINPDVEVKPRTIPIERDRLQRKIANPIFSFALDLVAGKIPGLEAFKVVRPLVFDYDLKVDELKVNEALYSAFRKYAEGKYKFSPPQIDREREFVERALRTELVTASYGSQTSFQVFKDYDDQLLKAIELLPQARQLAIQSERARMSGRKAAN